MGCRFDEIFVLVEFCGVGRLVGSYALPLMVCKTLFIALAPELDNRRVRS